MTPLPPSRKFLHRLRLLLKVGIVLAFLLLLLLASTRYMGFDRFVSSIPVNFQWQYLIAGVVLLLLAALLRFRIGMIMGCVLVLFQVPAFWPYFVGGSHSSEVANLRVTVANVQGANRQTGRVGAWIREMDADVVLLQETNDHWNEYLPRLHDLYPHHREVRCPEQWGFDATILSKHPIIEYEEVRVGPNNLPFQRAVIETPRGRVAVYNLHLFQAGPVRRLQNKILLEHTAAEDVPCIVAGDFNSTIWASVHQEFPGEANLTNVAFGRGYLPTWPARIKSMFAIFGNTPLGPWLPKREDLGPWTSLFARYFGVPIDHVYVSPELGVVDLERGPANNSDHLPMVVDLHLAPATVSAKQ